MQADEFMKNVEIRAELQNRDHARRAVEAVMDALRSRITPEAVDTCVIPEVYEHYPSPQRFELKGRRIDPVVGVARKFRSVYAFHCEPLHSAPPMPAW